MAGCTGFTSRAAFFVFVLAGEARFALKRPGLVLVLPDAAVHARATAPFFAAVFPGLAELARGCAFDQLELADGARNAPRCAVGGLELADRAIHARALADLVLELATGTEGANGRP